VIFISAMYHTCIFCNSPLGANEMLERFPVGRRIAYDEHTGRLWAVCRTCERWNLSPLETRWEAIEDAERLFRATPLRVAGENIGLAQTKEGLELVRIGRPPKLEMAAWRYGDQFGRRFRRRVALMAAYSVGAAGPTISMIGQLGAFAVSPAVGIAISLGSIASSIGMLHFFRRGEPRFSVRDDSGNLLRLTNQDARLSVLIPESGGWRLELSHSIPTVVRGRTERSRTRVPLRGEPAIRALSKLLPFLNWGGGTRQTVGAAVDAIGDTRSIDHLLALAARDTTQLKRYFKTKAGEANVSVLPAHLRLALEMTLHEDDERRAMEGELAVLEARWREADEIAKIVDSL
jgi:hypothetical protein